MEDNNENYFDKFTEDLERREAAKKANLEKLQKDESAWTKRRELDKNYREHPLQRTKVTR
jgi:hypothetical protein